MICEYGVHARGITLPLSNDSGGAAARLGSPTLPILRSGNGRIPVSAEPRNVQ